MHFNSHSELVGFHAFLSASKYHWIRYDDEKMLAVYASHREAQRGSELHDLAARLIKMGIRLPRTQRTLNMYVNDAISFRMTPEQVLYYSPNCFGTADAIHFSEKKAFLRIHDLKNGTSRASFDQLLVYAAIFCLEYHIPPGHIDMELRLYKEDDVEINVPETDDVAHVIDRIRHFDKLINSVKGGDNE